MVGGAVDHGEAGGGDVIHAVGHRNGAIGSRDRFFGKTAKTRQRHHSVADLEVFDAAANFDDITRDFAAGCKGHRWLNLVLALDDERIWEVHPASLHPDANFVRFYLWPSQCAYLQALARSPL